MPLPNFQDVLYRERRAYARRQRLQAYAGVVRQPIQPVAGFDPESWRGRYAAESDTSRPIDYPVILTRDGKPILAYVDLDRWTDDLRAKLQRLPRLLNGMPFNPPAKRQGRDTRHHKGVDRTFGYSPENRSRRHKCRTASLAAHSPNAHDAVCALAKEMSGLYSVFGWERFAQHRRLAARLKPHWRLDGTVFTSGIANKSNKLPYHFDRGNFPGVWSVMLVLRNNVEGGYLSIPEYDVSFELKNNSVLMFDGQSVLHGVTPMYHGLINPYRYSLVFYSRVGMWRCQ